MPGLQLRNVNGCSPRLILVTQNLTPIAGPPVQILNCESILLPDVEYYLTLNITDRTVSVDEGVSPAGDGDIQEIDDDNEKSDMDSDRDDDDDEEEDEPQSKRRKTTRSNAKKPEPIRRSSRVAKADAPALGKLRTRSTETGVRSGKGDTRGGRGRKRGGRA